MAKKGMVEREKKRQKLVIKYKKIRTEIIQSLKNSSTAPRSEQLVLSAKLQKIPRNSAPIRLKNRCNLTGRPKGYYRDFGLSRHALREMAHQGLLPGVTKASW